MQIRRTNVRRDKALLQPGPTHVDGIPDNATDRAAPVQLARLQWLTIRGKSGTTKIENNSESIFHIRASQNNSAENRVADSVFFSVKLTVVCYIDRRCHSRFLNFSFTWNRPHRSMRRMPAAQRLHHAASIATTPAPTTDGS
jgi:hypothetical protein